MARCDTNFSVVEGASLFIFAMTDDFPGYGYRGGFHEIILSVATIFCGENRKHLLLEIWFQFNIAFLMISFLQCKR